jgi:hypothetical protein
VAFKSVNEGRRLRLKCDGTRAETRFRLSAKRTSPFKSSGASVQSTAGSRGVRISGSNAGYTMFRDSVKSTGYPLHSPVSPSLTLPCVTVCHYISTGFYKKILLTDFRITVILKSVNKAADYSIIRRMRFACWVTKATDTIRICNTAFLGQQWLFESPSVLRYKYIACLVSFSYELQPWSSRNSIINTTINCSIISRVATALLSQVAVKTNMQVGYMYTRLTVHGVLRDIAKNGDS